MLAGDKEGDERKAFMSLARISQIENVNFGRRKHENFARASKDSMLPATTGRSWCRVDAQ